MQIQVSKHNEEKGEVEFLSLILKVLQQYELSPDLFPELKRDPTGPYFIMQGGAIKEVCTAIYEAMIQKYGDEEPAKTGGDPVLV